MKLGFEATHNRVSTYEPPQMRDAVMRRYRRIVETGNPERVAGLMKFMPDRSHISFEVVHLPLSGKGGGVEHIISAYDFDYRADDPD